MRVIDYLDGHDSEILFMEINNKRDLLVTGSSNEIIQYWDVSN